MENHKLRCHPSIILEKTGGFLTAWALILFSQIDNIISLLTSEKFDMQNMKMVLGFLGIMVLLLLLIAGYQFLVWRKTWIYIEENTLVIERNTLNRKKNTYSISHISNINTEQNLFELLIHTYRIKLDMENATDADSTDISIVLSARKAQELKLQLLSFQKGAIPAEETAERANAYASFSEILLHCICSLPGFFLITLLLLGAFFGFVLVSKTMTLSELLYDEQEQSFTMRVFAIGLLVITYGYQIVKRLLAFYHFSVFRQDEDIIIRYGFFRKQDYTIPVKRVHALRIVQAPVARLFHLYEARIVCVGIGDNEQELTQLILCCKKEMLYQRLAELLPEFSTPSMENVHRPPKHAGKVYASSFLSWFAAICVIPYLLMASFNVLDDAASPVIFLWIYGGISLLLLLYHLCRYCSLGFYLGDSLALFSGGSLTKTTTLVPYRKIQHLHFTQGPVSKFSHLFKGEVFILASILNRDISFPCMSVDDKEMLTEKMNERII